MTTHNATPAQALEQGFGLNDCSSHAANKGSVLQRLQRLGLIRRYDGEVDAGGQEQVHAGKKRDVSPLVKQHVTEMSASFGK